MTSTKSPGRAVLPKELARRAEAKAAQATARARREAEELLAVIQSRRQFITEAFYDVGLTLARLREPRLYTALGFSTFGALLEKRLGLTVAAASRLIGIVAQLSRTMALSLGQERCLALVRLARASSAEDSAETLARDGIALPGRSGRVSPRDLSVRDILSAVRHRHELRAAAKIPAWAQARTKVTRAAGTLRAALVEAGVAQVGTRVTMDTRKRKVTVHVQVSVDDVEALARVLGKARR